MTSTLVCRDVGFDCPEVIQGKNEEEVMQKAERHAQETHGMQKSDITPEMVSKIKSNIKES